ncbi:MAG: mevalonate kinase [Candidatus Bathyarchaeia archaeon]
MAQGYGFGKVILFNEHFVVYGVPAIASALDQKIVATVKASDGEGVILNDERKVTTGRKLDQQKESLDRIIKAIGIDPNRNPIKITLGGDLTVAGGVGASAASCVAITRALSEYFALKLSDEDINNIAYEGEKGYHGTPSGIDNTVATYGGLIWFKRGTPNIFEPIRIKEPFELVIGNTGITTDTKAAVEGVRKRREENPEKYATIFRAAEKVVYEARKALEAADLRLLGRLMCENHKLLQAAEVSCKELDFLVDLALEHGAFGAKLTGSGLGGSMIALTPGNALQERVAHAIKRAGFEVLKTRVGVKSWPQQRVESV